MVIYMNLFYCELIVIIIIILQHTIDYQHARYFQIHIQIYERFFVILGET